MTPLNPTPYLNPNGVYDEETDTYTTGTGQVLGNVHKRDECSWVYCVIHNQSVHPMKQMKTHWRADAGFMERICYHGVGHPDPDDPNAPDVHGCCGCCSGNKAYPT